VNEEKEEKEGEKEKKVKELALLLSCPSASRTSCV
jgi:hypothetical protein